MTFKTDMLESVKRTCVCFKEYEGKKLKGHDALKQLSII